MNVLAKIRNNPLWILWVLLRRISPLIKSDKIFIKLEYILRTHKLLNLSNPQSFNEKLQWLKLYARHEEYTQLVDKYAVKLYVTRRIGEKYVIPTLGVWERFEDIDFKVLPSQFVLKTTHDSGGVYICRDKSQLDINKAAKKLKKSLSKNYYWEHREYPYKNVRPRIIAEQYMVDESGYELKDYKIFCFQGVPHFIEVDFDRFTGHKRNIYSTQWKLLPFEIQYPSNPSLIHEKPKCLNEMLDIASQLSRGFLHVRVDLYVINDAVYFGELTFFHGTGMEKFSPEEWNYKFGRLIELPKD